MKRVALWVWLDTHFREMIRVARVLQRSSHYQPTIVFVRPYAQLPQDVALCRDEGIEVEDLSPGQSNTWTPLPPRNGNWTRRALRFTLSLIRQVRVAIIIGLRRLATRFFSTALTIRFYQRQRQWHRSTLQRLKPDLMIFPEDNVEYGTSTIIQLGHQDSIPSVVIPYTIANALEPAESYYQQSRFSARRPLNFIASYLRPRWKFEHKGRSLVRLPADHILAQHLFRLAPDQPWVLNSGRADVIALESQALFEYYVTAGLNPAQMRVTGSIRLDNIAAYRDRATKQRAALLDELGIPAGRRIVLCALPPDQLPHLRPGCEFESYEELISFWIKSLCAEEQGSVLVNLHPRIDYESVKHIQQWGATIVQQDIAQLIPLSDLFVASVSATISMAIACGTPVLNYDVYRYHYSDYERQRGVITVHEKAEFQAAVSRLLRDDDFYRQVSHWQAADADHWGILDGNAWERLLQLLDELSPTRRRDAA